MPTQMDKQQDSTKDNFEQQDQDRDGCQPVLCGATDVRIPESIQKTFKVVNTVLEKVSSSLSTLGESNKSTSPQNGEVILPQFLRTYKGGPLSPFEESSVRDDHNKTVP
ncbi:hypothetical protein JTE90_025085 [Oedothorax gibbosus]|uniref:Uncharacterized protein n=1 Tax=Oedothorax gibbosus TaxID=931172 RepID=A0AAV6TJD7_9ARAC|nr:hypothetical protein JTE90_025085 [Oedothorax gibbosus]